MILRLVPAPPPEVKTELVAYGFGLDSAAELKPGPSHWFTQVQSPFRPDRLIVWTAGTSWPETCFIKSLRVAGVEQFSFSKDGPQHVPAAMFRAPIPLDLFWECMRPAPKGSGWWVQVPGQRVFWHWPARIEKKHLLSSTVTPRINLGECNVGSRIELSYSQPLIGLAFLGEAVCEP